MNKFYELQVSVMLLNDIPVKDSFESIANILNYSFHKSDFMTSIHKSIGLKGYSFSGLYPIEKDSVYKSNTSYTFIIRTVSQTINNEIKVCLMGTENANMIVYDIQSIIRNNSYIDYVDTLTPAISTMNNSKRWNMNVDSMESIKKLIINNLSRKCNVFLGKEIDVDNIIEYIDIKSKCGIVIHYKNMKMIGYKFRVAFKDNAEAQQVANMSIALGIGEKNSSLGLGFVKPYFRRWQV